MYAYAHTPMLGYLGFSHTTLVVMTNRRQAVNILLFAKISISHILYFRNQLDISCFDDVYDESPYKGRLQDVSHSLIIPCLSVNIKTLDLVDVREFLWKSS